MRLPILLSVALLASACSDPPVGTEARPFTMYFVPSVDADTIATSSEEITSFVEEYVSNELYGEPTGFHVEGAIPTSYIAVVEAFGTGRADFAALNTYSYILARDVKQYDIGALVAVVRGEGETSYKGQILARADSGIESLADLEGKSFAYTDPSSTAGFLLPSRLMEANAIKTGETMFASKYDNVVTMIYQGQVDAGATYYSPPVVETIEGQQVTRLRDARARVLTQYPDVEEKVKIVGFTEETPNEPWVIRGNLFEDPAMQEKVTRAVREALLAFAASEEGKVTLESLYNISGFAEVDDEVYADIRQMVLDADLDLEASVK